MTTGHPAPQTRSVALPGALSDHTGLIATTVDSFTSRAARSPLSATSVPAAKSYAGWAYRGATGDLAPDAPLQTGLPTREDFPQPPCRRGPSASAAAIRTRCDPLSYRRKNSRRHRFGSLEPVKMNANRSMREATEHQSMAWPHVAIERMCVSTDAPACASCVHSIKRWRLVTRLRWAFAWVQVVCLNFKVNRWHRQSVRCWVNRAYTRLLGHHHDAG